MQKVTHPCRSQTGRWIQVPVTLSKIAKILVVLYNYLKSLKFRWKYWHFWGWELKSSENPCRFWGGHRWGIWGNAPPDSPKVVKILDVFWLSLSDSISARSTCQYFVRRVAKNEPPKNSHRSVFKKPLVRERFQKKHQKSIRPVKEQQDRRAGPPQPVRKVNARTPKCKHCLGKNVIWKD